MPKPRPVSPSMTPSPPRRPRRPLPQRSPAAAAAATAAKCAGCITTGDAETTACVAADAVDGSAVAATSTALASATIHGSAVSTSPFCRRSSTNATWSRSLSSASKSSGDPGVSASPEDSRFSIKCASSPSLIAPAMRALPLNVCSVRCSAWEASLSVGLRRQARSCSPVCGNNSAASSRKIGSTCRSTSSWMLASVSTAADTRAAAAAAGVAARGGEEDGGDGAAAVDVTTAVRIGRSAVASVGCSSAVIPAGGGVLETGVGRGSIGSSASATRAAIVSLSRSPGWAPVS